jgi:hypothetical protein
METIILNSKGQPIVLNEREKKVANAAQRFVNDIGYDINITTLTTILKKITEQKFYQIAFADYVPVVVGEGAWSQQLTTYKEYSPGGKFAQGIINTGANDDRLASVDTLVENVNTVVRLWAKTINWTLADLEYASKAGNWDLITAKESSRKRNWDLGVQEVAFLGLEGDTAKLPGLLNQAGITTNTTEIPVLINAMTTTQFQNLLQKIFAAYRANCNFTAYPTHFTIPEKDYNGLASLPDVTFPLKSKLEILLQAFKTLTMNPNFQILPCSYGNKEINGTANNIYALYNYDETSMRMSVPVPYGNTVANTVNGFQFQNVGYGQFTGLQLLRPAELLYFTNTI